VDLDHPVAAAEQADRLALVIGDRARNECRLAVARVDGAQVQSAGVRDIGCLSDLARVYWVDVNHDSQPELLLLTTNGNLSQTLRIYRVAGDMEQLAELNGYINGSDGVGIRWQDTPNGMQFETGVSYFDENANARSVTPVRQFKTYLWDNEKNGVVSSQ